MTHSAGGRHNRPSAGLSGSLSWQLTASEVIALAINVVQNGQDCRGLRRAGSSEIFEVAETWFRSSE